jgi:hypothetical protein
MSYPIEAKPASHNAWFTPAESNAYYKARYAREGVTLHWWGDGSGADNHDNTVNYILGQAQQGTKSVNFVLSDNKISQLVDPDNVAWCSQAGNPTTISIELQPTLSAEGYKKAGWLLDQLEKRYGHTMSLYPHSHWNATSCPGTIDINRIRAEADKWKNGSNGGAEEMIPDQDNYYWRYGQKTALAIRGRQLSREEFRHYLVGQTPTRALEILEDNPEADNALKALQLGQVAAKDNWQGQIYGLQDQLNSANTKIDELAKNPSKATLEDAQKELQACQATAQDLTAKLTAHSAAQTPKGAPAPSSSAAADAATASLLTKLLAWFLNRKTKA